MTECESLNKCSNPQAGGQTFADGEVAEGGVGETAPISRRL